MADKTVLVLALRTNILGIRINTLTDVEVIEHLRPMNRVEEDSTTVTLDKGHLHLEGEVAKGWIIRSAKMKTDRIVIIPIYACVQSSSLELTGTNLQRYILWRNPTV